MKSAVGRGLVSDDGQQLARLREHRVQTPGAVEELRLRPPRAPHPPGRLHHRLREQLLAGVPRRQRDPQLRPQPQEILGVLVEHHRRPCGQSMPQGIAARHRLARRRPGPRALQGVAAVGGDLGGGGHGSLDPIPSHCLTLEAYRATEQSAAPGFPGGPISCVLRLGHELINTPVDAPPEPVLEL